LPDPRELPLLPAKNRFPARPSTRRASKSPPFRLPDVQQGFDWGLGTEGYLHTGGWISSPNQKRQDWGAKYFEVSSSLIAEPSQTIILMLGGALMSYVIPELHPGIRFLRPEGNLSLREGDGLMDEIRLTLKAHAGPIMVLFDARDSSILLSESLRRLGLTGRPEQCAPLDTNVPDDLRLCLVMKGEPMPERE